MTPRVPGPDNPRRRLVRLGRQSRRLKWAGLALVASLTAAAFGLSGCE